MKKVLTVSLILNAALAIGLGWKEMVASAESNSRGGEVPLGNGDVNADGQYDISDAIYFLSWCFLGGPAPVPIACPPPPKGGPLPATGTTKCFNSDARVIDCSSGDFPGQDGFYQAGCPTHGRFVDHGDGTVTDTCTGLMWQQNTEQVMTNWEEALEGCEVSTLAGYDDWRLPNVRELHSIVDYGRTNPAINPVFTANYYMYWSSTPYAGGTAGVWIVTFGEGAIGGRWMTDQCYVRAVRGGW